MPLFAQVQPGAYQTQKYIPLLINMKVAVVGNQSSQVLTNDKRIHLVDHLRSQGVNIIKVFAPEHGFRGKEDAGASISNEIDTKTGIPIVSLHGKYRKPPAEQLADVDILVFDIQDVGVRFFTYLSTLHLVMEACADSKVPVIVLDRPNPNAHYVDGPMMEEENQSFLGKVPIPLVYGMTIGEYAKMLVGEEWLDSKNKPSLLVIPVANYTHQTAYELPVRPSPNLPNAQAVMLYPSLGLFEGTPVNAGRGTSHPFQQFGASFLDTSHFTHRYTPTPKSGASNPKEKQKECYGLDLRNHPRLDRVNIEWIIQAYRNSNKPEQFFLDPGFRRHAGTTSLQLQIEKGMSASEIRDNWQSDIQDFLKIRERYLIYP
ncbi:MAG: exo-beta-N-acetylmuramidase NamZ family protein [Flavobacteriaceae bacterium]